MKLCSKGKYLVYKFKSDSFGQVELNADQAE